MMSLVRKFLADQSGATAIEYGLLAAFLAVGLSVALSSLKDGLNSTFTSLTTTMSDASK